MRVLAHLVRGGSCAAATVLMVLVSSPGVARTGLDMALTIALVQSGKPVSPRAGQPLTFRVTATNVGTVALQQNLRIQLTRVDAAGVARDIAARGLPPTMQPGAAFAPDLTDSAPPAGTFTYRATLLPSGFGDVDTANNVADEVVTVSAPSRRFRALPMNVNPMPPRPGQLLTLAFAIRNTGEATLTGLDWAIRRRDVATNQNSTVAQGEIASLAPGATEPVSATWMGVAGAQQFRGDADPQNEQNEPQSARGDNLTAVVDLLVEPAAPQPTPQPTPVPPPPRPVVVYQSAVEGLYLSVKYTLCNVDRALRYDTRCTGLPNNCADNPGCRPADNAFDCFFYANGTTADAPPCPGGTALSGALKIGNSEARVARPACGSATFEHWARVHRDGVIVESDHRRFTVPGLVANCP